MWQRFSAPLAPRVKIFEFCMVVVVVVLSAPTRGMPDPGTIDRQKKDYLKMLDDQLVSGAHVEPSQPRHRPLPLYKPPNQVC